MARRARNPNAGESGTPASDSCVSVASSLGGIGYPSATFVRHVASGFEADVFYFESGGRKFALRLFPNGLADAKCRREACVLQHLRRAGYPVPGLESYSTAAASPWHRPFLVIQWIEGTPLSGPFWNPDRAVRDPARRTVLQLMSRLHSLECLPTLDPAGLEPIGKTLGVAAEPGWAAGKERGGAVSGDTVTTSDAACGPANAIPASFPDRLLGEPSDWPTDEYRSAYSWAMRAMASLPAHGPCLVHGDFHGGNVLISASGPVVIDWSNGSLGDPRHDLAWIRLLTVARSEPDMCQRELQWYEAPSFGLDELLPFEVVGAIKILSTISLQRSGRSAVLHAQAASRTDPQFVDYLLRLVRRATGEDVPSPL